MRESLKKWLPPTLKLTFKQKITYVVSVVVILGVFGFVSTSLGFFLGTGTFPFESSRESLLPPVSATELTKTEVIEFIGDDSTDLNRYDIGFNCVEYAFLLARNAQWKGLPAEVIRIDFTDATQHLVLAFPTVDEGWVFVNPQDDLEIKPVVGGKVAGRTVASMYILQAEWVPFEVLEVV